MGMEVVSKYKKQALLLLVLLGPCTRLYASTTGSVTIPSSVQVGDTVVLSINGYTEKMYYGPYSTVDSITAGLAAKLSSDCNGPANATSAPGGIVNVKMRGSGVVSQLSISVAAKIPTTSTATISSTVVPNGGSTTISGQVDCGTACDGATVDFQIDGAEWTTAALNGSGQFSISTPTNWAPGLHNVVANFLGNDTYLGSTSNAVSFTISTSSNPSLPSTTIYGYSILQPDGATSGYAPNGNVLAYSDSVNGQWSNIVYDGLNRLTAANYSAPSGATQYMCWGYDSFGNRTYQKESNTPCSSSPPPPLQYDAGNHAAGISYDASGNVINDGTNKYLYDAEGRVCAMQSSLGGAQVGYVYDAEGRRVAKGTISTLSCDMTSNGFTETAGYVLGPNGEQMTEMDGSGNWVHTNVFAAGQLIATYENDGQGVHFHLSDWLGTRHVSTDYAGNLQSSYQNLPFGELLPSNESLGVTEHFYTGKERDSESGLDYFGARYYASSMGRWMSPDWASDPTAVPYASYANPQSLNLYSYVFSNPLSAVDPDGHGCAPEEIAACHAITVAISNGMEAGEALQAGQQALQPLSNASEQAIQSSNLTGSQAGAFEGAVSSAGAANLINPNLLVGLAYKESSLDPTADNDGARGLYQIRRPRQKDLGLSDADVTSVDAVVGPVAKYLAHSSSVLNGSIDLTIGSWRQGIAGISRLNAQGPNAVRDLVINPAAHGRPARTLGKDYIDVVESFF